MSVVNVRFRGELNEAMRAMVQHCLGRPGVPIRRRGGKRGPLSLAEVADYALTRGLLTLCDDLGIDDPRLQQLRSEAGE